MRGWMIGLLTAFGCGSGNPSTTPEPAAAPEAAPPAPEEDPQERLGTVLSTLDADNYTYAKLDNCGDEAWVAGPKTALVPGSVVAMPMGMAMENFESKALKRTFDVILFVDWFRPVDGALSCPEPTPETAALRGTHSTDEKPPPPAKFHGTVVESMVSGGYRYVQLDLCGKTQWFAGPKMPIDKGAILQIREGVEMANFEAKSLGHTFESIWFVTSFVVTEKPPRCG